jgi:hypothetical protein
MENGRKMPWKHDPRFCSESKPNGEDSYVAAFENKHSVNIASWALYSCECTSGVEQKQCPICKEG